MTTAVVPMIDPAVVERVLLQGDLRQLSAAQKVSYYKSVCESVGLNPLTQPFQYLVLNGKEILYASRSATEQLRKVHSVSIQIMAREVVEDCYVVTARATLPTGRQDENIGAVPISGLKGENRANAMMKAETKAKRRVTLAICGLGMLDESEVESIPQASVKLVMPAAPTTDGATASLATPSPEWQKVLADAKRDIAEPTPEAETVNTETGEVLPPGFALIDDYKIDGDNGEWHHITWGKDAQGGGTVYKTKLAKIANQARVAFNDRVAVKLHAKKMPYLDRVERLDGLDGTMSKAAIAATKWNPDDLDKQGF